jgi:hypothetical protein
LPAPKARFNSSPAPTAWESLFCGQPFLICCLFSQSNYPESKPLKLGHKNSQKRKTKNGKGNPKKARTDLVTNKVRKKLTK